MAHYEDIYRKAGRSSFRTPANWIKCYLPGNAKSNSEQFISYFGLVFNFRLCRFAVLQELCAVQKHTLNKLKICPWFCPNK